MDDGFSLADSLSFDTEEFFRFASKYKFILAIENAVCEDYITEKLWRSLIVGSVPIYFGSPSIRDWLPNYDSAILIAEFDNVQILATYINELDNDDERYNHYLRHKIDGVISNKFLKNTVKSRRWNRYENIVEEFECQLCAQLHEFESGSQNDVPPVDATHYSCQSPESARLPVKNDDKKGPVTDEWSAIFRSARCEGKAIFELASENEPYTRQRLDQRSHQLLLDNAC